MCRFDKLKGSLSAIFAGLMVAAGPLFLTACGGSGSIDESASAAGSNDRKEAQAVPGTWTGRVPVPSYSPAVTFTKDTVGREIVAKQMVGSLKGTVDLLQVSSYVSTKGWKLLSFHAKLRFAQIEIPTPDAESLDGAIAEARRSPLFEAVEKNFRQVTNAATDDPDQYKGGRDWAIEAIGAKEAWQRMNSIVLPAANVPVGLVDSGYRYDHPDLSIQTIFESDGKTRSRFSASPGCTVEPDNPCVQDHGMHVAGTIAATSGNGKGIAGISNNAATLYARVSDFTDVGNAVALNDLAERGARVVNISMGDTNCVKTADNKDSCPDRESNPVNTHWHILKNLISTNPKTLFVQSSGNDGDRKFDSSGDKIYSDYNGTFATLLSRKWYPKPSSVRDAITSVALVVGALRIDRTFTDELEVADYTSLPSPDAGLDYPFILAPGGCSSECGPIAGWDEVYSAMYRQDPLYGSKSGTSMAAPHVAAVAAMLFKIRPELDAAQVKSIILSSAKIHKSGYKQLDANAAVRLAIEGRAPPIVYFTQSAYSAKTNQIVEFNPTAQSTNGPVTSYRWSFGDGSTQSLTDGQKVSHSFSTPGRYVVQLLVTDSAGIANISTQHIDVVQDILPNETPNLIGRYTFDYTLADSVGSNAPLNYVGDAFPSYLYRGTSPAISLSADQYLSRSSGKLVPLMKADGYHSFSVATWVKLDAWAPATNAIVYEREFNGADGGYAAYGIANYLYGGERKWLFSLSTVNDAGVQTLETLFSTAAGVLGRWYHLAATYDQASGLARLYVDGQVAAEKTIGKRLNMHANPYMSVGAQPWGADQAIRGAVDDLRFYRGALTPQEVALIAETLKTNPANGHRYEVITCGNWLNCKATAEARGGKLATIRNQDEQNWIVTNMLPLAQTKWGFWIGYNDRARDGTWVWDSGEQFTFTAWSSWYNPNPNNEDAAHMGSFWQGRWNDDLSTDELFGQALVEYQDSGPRISP